MSTRVCIDCKQEKVFAELVVNSKCKFGHRKLCLACNVKRVKSRTDKNEKAAYDKTRRAKKLTEIREYDRFRRSAPERKAQHNECTRRRRAKIRNAVPDDFDRFAVLAMYRLAQKLTRLMGVEMHVDHIVPISKGGRHNICNLQILAGRLNLAKRAKSDWFLIKPHFQLPHTNYPDP
jgi:5-methylcytosine-specific restriction endonuclease McrA